MDEIGLAQQSAIPQPPQIQPDMLKEVIQMLMGGATEAQLLQMGVPPEVIQAAIAEISKQQPMPEGAGLAQQQGLI